MSYIWNKFNIKTFPAQTIVYCDGYYQEQFSTLPETTDFFTQYDLPIHIIYVGNITGENTLNINLFTQNQPVYLTVDTENKFPAFLNVFIKNTGKNSNIMGHILCKNSSDLALNIVAEHDAPESGILMQTKIIGNKSSYCRISGTAIINTNCISARSNLSFCGYAPDKSAKIRFKPSQRILSVPEYANHSASMFKIDKKQELYLRESGLSGSEVKETMLEAFMKDFNLF